MSPSSTAFPVIIICLSRLSSASHRKVVKSTERLGTWGTDLFGEGGSKTDAGDQAARSKDERKREGASWAEFIEGASESTSLTSD